jgi:hypothetical protein
VAKTNNFRNPELDEGQTKNIKQKTAKQKTTQQLTNSRHPVLAEEQLNHKQQTINN